MQIHTSSFSDGGRIPAEFAFCVPDAETHVAFGANRNPDISWSDLPSGTRSLALICHDRDVPTKPDDVNQEGREVPADLPRADFYHWVLVDVDPGLGGIAAGEFSDGVTARGKGPGGPGGTRQGRNDYTGWFAGDADMEGSYFGYDGPCPPWNDTIVHHYTFTLYALDIDRCAVEGEFGAVEVLEAIEGHVLDQDSIMGTYSINPDAR
ncbi:MAG: YbhB/YbcL family Raf kinase inhibitor-like protein [Acidimicrobiia bacterium]